MRILPVTIIFCLLSGNLFAHEINLDAIAQIESSGNPEAVGKAGERGLFQISPIVLKHFKQTHSGIIEMTWPVEKIKSDDLFYPKLNRFIADWYFSWLESALKIHGIDPTEEDMIVAYNWGLRHFLKWYECPWEHKGDETIPGMSTSTCGMRIGLPKTTQDYLKKYHELTKKKS